MSSRTQGCRPPRRRANPTRCSRANSRPPPQRSPRLPSAPLPLGCPHASLSGGRHSYIPTRKPKEHRLIRCPHSRGRVCPLRQTNSHSGNTSARSRLTSRGRPGRRHRLLLLGLRPRIRSTAPFPACLRIPRPPHPPTDHEPGIYRGDGGAPPDVDLLYPTLPPSGLHGFSIPRFVNDMLGEPVEVRCLDCPWSGLGEELELGVLFTTYIEFRIPRIAAQRASRRRSSTSSNETTLSNPGKIETNSNQLEINSYFGAVLDVFSLFELE